MASLQPVLNDDYAQPTPAERLEAFVALYELGWDQLTETMQVEALANHASICN